MTSVPPSSDGRWSPPLYSYVSLLVIILLHVTVTSVYGQSNDQADFDKIINEVFTTQAPIPGSCKCVPFYLCNNQTVNTDGTGLIDIRFNEGSCTKSLEICCSDFLSPAETTTISNIPKRINCGHWNSGGVGFRITGNTNNEAQFGEFPWMVAILIRDPVNQSTTYLCGGSLIHPEVVLTAVHCINDKNPDNLVIRAGEWDSQTENELFPYQDSLVSKIIKHENYYGGALYNDVALIFVKTPYILRDNVGTICLPPQGFKFNKERCYASGWGKDVFGIYGVDQVILKKIDLPIVQRNQCLNLLRMTRLGPNYKLHESFICAGGEIGKDTCKGDGGSPLMCPTLENPEQFHQAGIVAWGIGCGDKTPGVYVDVARFRHWIDQHMIANNMDTSFYDAYYTTSSIN